MRKTGILLALLCLFIVFQIVYAQIDPEPYNRPRAKEGLQYDGHTWMELYDKGSNIQGGESYTFYYRYYTPDSTSDWHKETVLKGKYPGIFGIEWVACK